MPKIDHESESDRWVSVPVERTYEMRSRAMLAFDAARKDGGDLDDCLQAAWAASLSSAPGAP